MLTMGLRIVVNMEVRGLGCVRLSDVPTQNPHFLPPFLPFTFHCAPHYPIKRISCPTCETLASKYSNIYRRYDVVLDFLESKGGWWCTFGEHFRR